MKRIGHYHAPDPQDRKEQPSETPSFSRSWSPTGNRKNSPVPPKVVAAIFAKFQARYPHIWSSAFPTPANLEAAIKEWSEVLSGLSPEKLWYGLRLWDRDKPPSAPEFRRLCRQAPMYQPHRALPKPKPTKQIAEAAFHEMRTTLKVTPGNSEAPHEE